MPKGGEQEKRYGRGAHKAEKCPVCLRQDADVAARRRPRRRVGPARQAWTVRGKRCGELAPDGEVVERGTLEQSYRHGGKEGKALHKQDRAKDRDLGHLLVVGEIKTERAENQQRPKYAFPEGGEALGGAPGTALGRAQEGHAILEQ